MTTEHRTRTFKSGNSVALRLPKGLGIGEGIEMKVREEQGQYIVERVDQPKAKLDVDSFWGKATGLHVPERYDFDDRPSTIAARERSAEK